MPTPLETIGLLDQAFNRRDLEAILDFYEEGAILVAEPGRLATGRAELRTAFYGRLKEDVTLSNRER